MQLKSNLRAIILVSCFAALTAIGSYIKLPLIYLPVTLQTLFVMMSGNILGGKFGSLSQILYITLGLMGLPIFAYGGGLGYVLQPTFGYLLSYPFAALGIGMIMKMFSVNWRIKPPSMTQQFVGYLLADITGVIIIFSMGIAYFYINLKMGWYLNIDQLSQVKINFHRLLKTILFLFIPIDVLKAIIASWLTVRLRHLRFWQ
ncbi:MAG: biotin transporter BioY [candidate division KSB1 bacterium]|nr:biotin transporter BioY [candidate division KSB1 bacterium]